MAATLIQNSKQISFKSTGQLITTREQRRSSVKPREVPIGISTPVTLDYGGFAFIKMNTTVIAQVTDNLKQLILTNHGDRLGLYDFGANLLELTFEMQNDSVQGEAMKRISQTASKYMPFVELETFESFVEHFDNKDIAKIGIKIRYNVPQLNAYGLGMEVVLYVAG